MNFVVVGAGAWGTAFALHLSRIGNAVVLVPRRAEQAQELTARRENAEYLPGIILPRSINVTASLANAMSGADVIMLACPAQVLRETSVRVRDSSPGVPGFQLIISLAKGLELGTHLRPSEIMSEMLPGVPVGSLSGPTNALGVARGDPSAMVLALDSPNIGLQVQASLSSPTLRVYTSDDLPGVEFGSCLKNIYAIAAGVCDGLKLGDNTKAALLTRALAEMVRVGVALGARTETFYGLSGFGDLVATSYGGWSRNREFGQQIGEGGDVATLIANRKTVVEGYKTAEAFASLCAARNIEAPILAEMDKILFHGKTPAAAISALMSRELKRESWAGAAR
jgi:glycerol-3-phosphate dehydrogenase (NAD(P)+)